MILNTFVLLFPICLFVLFDWRVLRGGNALTWFVYIALYGVSVLVWLYLNEAEHVFFPDLWLLERIPRFFVQT